MARLHKSPFFFDHCSYQAPEKYVCLNSDKNFTGSPERCSAKMISKGFQTGNTLFLLGLSRQAWDCPLFPGGKDAGPYQNKMQGGNSYWAGKGLVAAGVPAGRIFIFAPVAAIAARRQLHLCTDNNYTCAC